MTLVQAQLHFFNICNIGRVHKGLLESVGVWAPACPGRLVCALKWALVLPDFQVQSSRMGWPLLSAAGTGTVWPEPLLPVQPAKSLETDQRVAIYSLVRNARMLLLQDSSGSGTEPPNTRFPDCYPQRDCWRSSAATGQRPGPA